jgi:hypothetical protein
MVAAAAEKKKTAEAKRMNRQPWSEKNYCVETHG